MRSWLGEFARGCAVFSAAALWGAPQGNQAAKPPLLVLLDGDAGRWRETASAAGWQLLATWTDLPEKNIDLRVKALEKRVTETVARLGADENRVYLAGQADGAAVVFYVASRLPDVWAAAVAVGGAARPAIDTGRLFGGNTSHLPILWLGAGKENEGEAERLKSAGYDVEVRTGTATAAQVAEWLAAQRRDPFPETADCETGTQVFPRCYWIEVTRFDPSERNDALPSTRIPPIGSGAYLDLGGFGYDRGAPGPGAVVTWLPEGYSGPLKVNDRLVALGGKTVADGAAYAAMMEQTTEEKPLAASVQRGKERLRVETRIVVPKREENITARVQGHFAPDVRELVVMSRAVGQMRLHIPQAWVPAAMNWNGTELGKADAPGCWLLDEKNALLSARRCE